MAKKTKHGKVKLSKDELNDENLKIRISMMITMKVYKELKHLALNEKHQGKYQLLIQSILAEYVAKNKK